MAIPAPKRSALRLRVGLLIAVAFLVLAAANAHLVYVSLASHPGCVPHLNEAGAKAGEYRAARSAC